MLLGNREAGSHLKSVGTDVESDAIDYCLRGAKGKRDS